MSKLYRLQVAFKNKQSNIALTFLDKTRGEELCDVLHSEVQSMSDKFALYFDDAGNSLYVRGTMIDYMLFTDLETDLEAMVTMQSMTAMAQARAQAAAEKAAASLPRIHTARN